MEEERERILNIYEDRTNAGKTKEQLKTFMLQEKERTTDELLEWGFIAKKNNYNTNKFNNQKKSKMSKNGKTNLIERIGSFFGTFKNYAFQDEDGNELFTTEQEDSALEIGMLAAPDGTFETSEGLIVSIEQGEIIAIVATDSKFAKSLETETEETESEEETKELETENKALRNKLETANALLKEAKNRLEGRRQTASNYKVKGRTIARTTNKSTPVTKEEIRSKLKDDK